MALYDLNDKMKLNLITFLSKVPLIGKEVPAFVEIVESLEHPVSLPVKPVPPAGREVKEGSLS